MNPENEKWAIYLTMDQIKLLQSVFVYMVDRLDWNDSPGGFIEARVLLNPDESVPSKIKKIFDKLF